jgi:hypothetical protein
MYESKYLYLEFKTSMHRNYYPKKGVRSFPHKYLLKW